MMGHLSAQEIAEALAHHRPRMNNDEGPRMQWTALRIEFMYLLAQNNAGFNGGKFIETTEQDNG